MNHAYRSIWNATLGACRSGYAGALRAGASAMVVATAVTFPACPALADGGAGSWGAAGGSGYSGAAGTASAAGGGGGGAAGGGNGGDGLVVGGGGAGGTFASPNGANGLTAAGNFGGGGGGGGWNGNDPNGQPGGTGTASIVVGAGNSLTGGNGGNGGGSTSCGVGCDGGGGGGGYGAIVTGGGASSNAGTVAGGNGGRAGGIGAAVGGGGGFGVQFTGAAAGAVFTNSGTVTGGAGGGVFGNGGAGGTGVAFAASGSVVNSGTIAGGNGGAATNSNGAGGAGITGGDLSVTNSGTITGGLGGDGVTRANAITFTSGANTLTLQAGSTITGNVVVNTGGGATGTLVLGGNTSASFNNSLIGSQYTGFTTFQKSGASTWSLTGTDAQAWTVSAGTLQVGDSAHGSATIGSADVGAGGTLSGHGTVTGNVVNTSGGIVSPGGSIGTLTVGGNYTQNAASTLAIEVSPTAASKLAVTGTANLAGTLALTYTPGVYTNRSYTIVQAANVAGTFGTVTGTAPAGGSQSVSYGPTTVTLTLSGFTSAPTFTVAPTVSSVLGQVGSVALSGAQSANSLLMSHLGGAAWDDGLASTSASAFAPIQLAFAGNAGDIAALLTQAPRAAASSGGWVRGYGAHSSVDGSGDATGYRTNDGGFLAGYDRELSRDVKAGLAVGYGHSRLRSQDGGSATLASPRIMAYGSWQPGPWAADAAVGYAADTIDTERPLPTGTATASHRAHEITAEAQVRAGFDIGGVALMPAAGLRHVRVSERGYTEAGAGGNNLTVDGRSVKSTQPFVGLVAARAFSLRGDMVWTPRAEVEYARELNDIPSATVSVGGGTFTAAGAVPSRDRLTVGLGLNGKLRDDLRFDVSYRLTRADGDYLRHAMSAGLRYRF